MAGSTESARARLRVEAMTDDPKPPHSRGSFRRGFPRRKTKLRQLQAKPLPPLTPEGLEEVRQREKAASPGPWQYDTREFISQASTYMAICRVNYTVVEDAQSGKTISGSRLPIQDFIAHAREDIPRLLATVGARNKVLSQFIKGFEAEMDGSAGSTWGLDEMGRAVEQARALLEGRSE